ncbi:MAG: phosphate/phosphite/phosphonate ABC transporter substrate-binding protein [Magnetococcales bacterium]|nr:PhnD/SsuA/transferrin family substrate-binding protein [Magnetococcales bacterium]NGZ25740.1 phosphate/phosphite/phosphonate ABC transporter substrate-binding protein [Magnetococcales bacterium]
MLGGCSAEQNEEYHPRYAEQPHEPELVYLFGVHPLHNPERLFEIYQPLVSLINQQLQGVRLELEASRNYAAYEEKLFSGRFHLALPNPYQTIRSLDSGYRVFGKMGDDDNFRGIILVRKDSKINNVMELKGKAVSYPAPTALAATMLPQWFFHSHGLDIRKDMENRYVGSQESSIMNVYLGQTAAGATWPLPWRAFSKERPQLAQQLEVKWQTHTLPNNGLVVLDDIPQQLVEQIGKIFFKLHTHAEGKAILAPMALSQFEAADNATYQPVREFLTRFEKEVRPIREEP